MVCDEILTTRKESRIAEWIAPILYMRLKAEKTLNKKSSWINHAKYMNFFDMGETNRAHYGQINEETINGCTLYPSCQENKETLCLSETFQTIYYHH